MSVVVCPLRKCLQDHCSQGTWQSPSADWVPPLTLHWSLWVSALPAPSSGLSTMQPLPWHSCTVPMHGRPWTMTVTFNSQLSSASFMGSWMLQEGPAEWFLEPTRLFYPTKARLGGSQQGKAEHQPRQSQILSQAILASKVFLMFYHRPRYGGLGPLLWTRKHLHHNFNLWIFVSSLIPFPDSSFLLLFLSHMNCLYTIEPFSLHWLITKYSDLQALLWICKRRLLELRKLFPHSMKQGSQDYLLPWWGLKAKLCSRQYPTAHEGRHAIDTHTGEPEGNMICRQERYVCLTLANIPIVSLFIKCKRFPLCCLPTSFQWPCEVDTVITPIL